MSKFIDVFKKDPRKIFLVVFILGLLALGTVLVVRNVNYNKEHSEVVEQPVVVEDSLVVE